MARREASLPHTAVDTAITMTRGGDKLRTVCGRLRWNPAECGSTRAAISVASALGASVATRPICDPAQDRSSREGPASAQRLAKLSMIHKRRVMSGWWAAFMIWVAWMALGRLAIPRLSRPFASVGAAGRGPAWRSHGSRACRGGRRASASRQVGC